MFPCHIASNPQKQMCRKKVRLINIWFYSSKVHERIVSVVKMLTLTAVFPWCVSWSNHPSVVQCLPHTLHARFKPFSHSYYTSVTVSLPVRPWSHTNSTSSLLVLTEMSKMNVISVLMSWTNQPIRLKAIGAFPYISTFINNYLFAMAVTISS